MIGMNAFHREPPELITEELAAAERVLRSGWFILGAEVEAFEALWAEWCGTAACIGVGNGMDAIEIGLRACGVGPGDEVIAPTMTAFATVLAILRAGATPVLADIDPDTGLMDLASAERCLSPRTRAIVLVHLYGQVKDLDTWLTWCRRESVALVEDCAQAHGARWQGRPAGSWGRFGAYSFYPTKNLGTCGDGGAIVTDDLDIAERSRSLRNYGQAARYHHPVLGLNSRLDELHAALLRTRLRWLSGFNDRRSRIAADLHMGISNPRVVPMAPPVTDESHVHHLFVVRCEERDRLQRHLQAAGIGALIHYPVPAHLQDPCRTLPKDPEGLPRAERHARECLSLPSHPFLGDDEVLAIIESVNDFA
jgi:dTDP-4-amino-4,6-dideoxygalactose transaminase